MFGRRFIPLFIMQFISAFSDNVYRNAMLMFLTFGLADDLKAKSALIVSLAGGIFILPSFLFSATAGQVADKYEKAFLIQLLKFVEIILMALAGWALAIGSIPAMLGSLFLLGMSGTFLGPIKYSILPQLLSRDQLVAANSYVEGGTFIAILLGSILGGFLMISAHGAFHVSMVLVKASLAALIVSFLIPRVHVADPLLRIDVNPLRATWQILKEAYENKMVFHSILGISWLWFLGSVFLTLFPTYVRDVLHADPKLALIFLATFSFGIAIGSALCQVLLRGRITAQYVPLAAFGMAFFSGLVACLSFFYTTPGEGMALTQFLRAPQSWPIILSLFLLAVSSGVFSVPLYALIQARSDERNRARMVAANNIVNSLGLVISAVFTGSLLAAGLTIGDVFLVTAFVGLGVYAYTRAVFKEADSTN